jgi:hypothetical protein
MLRKFFVKRKAVSHRDAEIQKASNLAIGPVWAKIGTPCHTKLFIHKLSFKNRCTWRLAARRQRARSERRIARLKRNFRQQFVTRNSYVKIFLYKFVVWIDGGESRRERRRREFERESKQQIESNKEREKRELYEKLGEEEMTHLEFLETVQKLEKLGQRCEMLPV